MLPDPSNKAPNYGPVTSIPMCEPTEEEMDENIEQQDTAEATIAEGCRFRLYKQLLTNREKTTHQQLLQKNQEDRAPNGHPQQAQGET